MNPFTLMQIIIQASASIPKVIEAIQQIMASDAAHTVESAFQAWFDHNTAGAPGAPALSESAKPLAIAMPMTAQPS